jgi:nicotinamidase-related amidase
MEKLQLQLDPKKSALILIDLQHGIVGMQTQPHSAKSVVEKSAMLANRFREKNATVIYVRVDLADMTPLLVDVSHSDPNNPPPPIASELVPESGFQSGDVLITKRHWSAFSGTDLEEQLRKAGVNTVVIGGIATNFGVESTARAAAGLGFAVVLPEDATTSISADAHNFTYQLIFPMLGRVRKAAEVAEALV